MRHLFRAALCASLSLTAPAFAQEADLPKEAEAPAEAVVDNGQHWLGHGRIFDNDLWGDGQDRWQTGSVQGSHARGTDWAGALPDKPFALMEYRLAGQVMAPANLRQPRANDRPFASALSFGAHSHFQRSGHEIALGAELVLTGPQTGLDDLQTAIHEGVSAPTASEAVLDGQIEDGLHLGLVAEAGHPLALSGQAVLRPFVEMRAGPETLARVGADLVLGRTMQDELLVRDGVTGQRYRVIRSEGTGTSVVLGADLARVWDSLYLPDPRETRSRLRLGLHHQFTQGAALFYGVTWLGKEDRNQHEGQVVGSIQLRIRF